MTYLDYDALLPANPLDKIEDFAATQDWAFDRADEDELDIVVNGAWGDYAISVSWRGDMGLLLVAAELDLKVPARKRSRAAELLALINEQLLVGHFDLWSDEGIVLFRHGLLLRGSAGVSLEQCEDLMKAAVAACDQFYPAFQFLIWADHSPRDAFRAVIFDTKGQA